MTETLVKILRVPPESLGSPASESPVVKEALTQDTYMLYIPGEHVEVDVVLKWADNARIVLVEAKHNRPDMLLPSLAVIGSLSPPMIDTLTRHGILVLPSPIQRYLHALIQWSDWKEVFADSLGNFTLSARWGKDPSVPRPALLEIPPESRSGEPNLFGWSRMTSGASVLPDDLDWELNSEDEHTDSETAELNRIPDWEEED